MVDPLQKLAIQLNLPLQSVRERVNAFLRSFEPLQRSLTVQVGESGLAYYRATNTSDQPVTGIASYNVAPYKAALYFSKIQCFCFTEQTLEPGESMDMPVLFFVDPLIDDERRMDDVSAFTLSYTFFETDGAASASSDAAP